MEILVSSSQGKPSGFPFYVYSHLRIITSSHAAIIISPPRLMLAQPRPFRNAPVPNLAIALSRILKVRGLRLHIQPGRMVLFHSGYQITADTIHRIQRLKPVFPQSQRTLPALSGCKISFHFRSFFVFHKDMPPSVIALVSLN